MKRNLAVMFAVAAISCSDPIQPSPAPPKDTTPPVVTSVSPTDGANDVSVTTKVVVEFSEPVDPATVNLTTFKVLNGDNLVPGSASASSSQATFTPDDSLDYLTTYTAVVSRVKDLAGNQMLGEHRWSFTTVRDSTLWTLPAKYLMTGVAADESGVYVIGSTQDSVTRAWLRDIFVAGFGLDGKRLWLAETSTPESEGVCDIAVSHGALYVGRVFGTFSIPSSLELYVDKRDADTGALVWSTLVGTGGDCSSIAVDESGVYLVTLPYIFRLALEDGAVTRTLENRSVGGVVTVFHSVAVDNNSIYIGGTTSSDLVNERPDGAGGFDFFVVAYDKDLRSRRWLSQWGDSLLQVNPEVSLAENSGRLYLGGFSGTFLGSEKASVILAYHTASGDLDWFIKREPANPCIATDGSDGYVILPGTSEFPPMPSPFRVRPDSTVVWTASSPALFNDFVGDVVVENGTVYIANNTSRLLRYDAETGAIKQ